LSRGAAAVGESAPRASVILPAVAITRDDVLHVARLARLSLTDEEAATMEGQLSTILGHVEALAGLDLAAVEPTAHALGSQHVTRPDAARPSWPLDVVLENAPAAQDGAFRVPAT
jgi:aspartyl-tRNA(Asn)/glutamyl-tRNA(Gln) amidotransferase subunit C